MCLEQIINCSSNGKGGIKEGLFYSMERYISSNAWDHNLGREISGAQFENKEIELHYKRHKSRNRER